MAADCWQHSSDWQGQAPSVLVKNAEIRAYWGFAEALGARHMGRRSLPPQPVRQKKDLLPMTDALKLGFGPFAAPAKGVLVVFCDDGLKFGPATAKALGSAADLVARAAKAERFTGKKSSALELVVPQGLKAARLVVIGPGKTADLKPKDFLKLGGLAMGKLPSCRERRHRVCRTAGRRHESPTGRRSGARRASARLCIRPLQDQAQRRREAAGDSQRDRRRRRCRSGAQGL